MGVLAYAGPRPRSWTAVWAALLAGLTMAGCGGGGGGAAGADEPELTARVILDRLPAAATAGLRWSHAVDLDLGSDDGRALGTVFELHSAEGSLVAAAGFVNGMQTTASNDNRSINFFVGRNGDADGGFGAAPTALSRPYGADQLFLLTTYRDTLLAYRYHRPGPVRAWDNARQRWVDFVHSATADSGNVSIRNIQTVDNRLLVIYDNGIRYGSRMVDLAPLGMADLQAVSMGLYAAGRMQLSVVGRDADGVMLAGVSTCAWDPALAVLSACRFVPEPATSPDSTLDHLPSGLHRLADGSLLTYGLQGDLFALSDTGWAALREGRPGESWQAYTSLDSGADVLLGQYPSGNLFSLSRAGDRQPWSIVEQSPAVNASTDVRRDELQSLMRIGDELLAGLWPWGEIYRGQPGAAWRPLLRAFGDDGGVPGIGHPYEALAGSNCLGQRIFQIIPWQRGFVFSTTLKNEDDECAGAAARLTGAQRDEYGRVYYVERADMLTCPLVWPSGASRLLFALTQDRRLFVAEDGRLLCESRPASDAAVAALTRGNNQFAVSGSNDHGVAGLFGLALN